MTPLEQVSGCHDCGGCGACCTEQAALPVSWYAGTAFRFGDPDTLPSDLLSELVEMRGRFLRDGFPRDGSPCVWYDAETKRCKHYEHRPDICRDEVNPGDEACLRWRAAVLPKEARRAD